MTVPKIKRVAIIPRLGKRNISSICSDVLAWLSGHQIEAVLPISDAQALGQEQLGISEDNLMQGVDLTVVLGGDGTILRAVRLLKGSDTPILGVNLGTFGFLAEVETSQLLDSMEKIIAAQYQIEKRMMLNCEIVSGHSTTVINALNEIFVGRGNAQRLAEFDVKINNIFFDRISCDGLIFASPTGSTAYALSAGGPLVSPSNHLIIFLPVCPHSLFNRSIILNETETIEVAPAEQLSKTSVAIDGIDAWRNQQIDYIRVKSAEAEANLVRFGERDFYAILRDKLRIFTSLNG